MKLPLPWFKAVLLLMVILAGCLAYSSAGAQSSPVVQAVLFYRSTCSHCVQLVNEILPPILEKYEARLQVFYCDVSYPAGDDLFTAAIDRFSIKNIGVPTIIVGNEVLIGTIEIQQKFPGLIDTGLAQGGLGWPDIPGLQEAFPVAGSMQLPALGMAAGPSDLLPLPGVTELPPASQAASSGSVPIPPTRSPAEKNSLFQNFLQDPRGNSLAVILLTGMVLAIIYGTLILLKKPTRDAEPRKNAVSRYFVPLLCLIGLGISAYLAYVELSLAEAMCGPVGNCNAVQSSEYARLFGILPIGVMGLVGYAAIAFAWLGARFGRRKWAGWAALVLFGLTSFGLVFSIYLTFLEPFVIGATCLWCLGSAAVMTALFLLCLRPGKELIPGPSQPQA